MGTGLTYMEADASSGTYVQMLIGDLTGGTYIGIDGSAHLVTIANVPTYANDAAATAAGLTTGKLYKTTTLGTTSLNIVP